MYWSRGFKSTSPPPQVKRKTALNRLIAAFPGLVLPPGPARSTPFGVDWPVRLCSGHALFFQMTAASPCAGRHAELAFLFS